MQASYVARSSLKSITSPNFAKLYIIYPEQPEAYNLMIEERRKYPIKYSSNTPGAAYLYRTYSSYNQNVVPKLNTSMQGGTENKLN